jgi:hypothetical protein
MVPSVAKYKVPDESIWPFGNGALKHAPASYSRLYYYTVFRCYYYLYSTTSNVLLLVDCPLERELLVPGTVPVETRAMARHPKCFINSITNQLSCGRCTGVLPGTAAEIQ